MSVTLVVLMVFLAVVFGAGFLMLTVQQLMQMRSGRETSIVLPARLRRRLRASREDSPGGPVSRFDSWLSGLVRDSDVSWEPVAVALMVILSGLIVAGGLFLWKEEVIATFLGFVVGMLPPLAYLLYCKQKRIKQLQQQFPGALDMLARSVRAGQSLDQSLGVVGRQSPEPLAGVFRISATQLEMGMSMPSVMQSLVERVRMQDMRIFTTTLNVHRQTGGNVAKVLERLASVVRERLSYRRQLRVATGAGKASAMIVALIGPLVFLFFFFFRPEYINTMLESPSGQMLLVFIAFLELVGLIWTARLLKPTL